VGVLAASVVGAALALADGAGLGGGALGDEVVAFPAGGLLGAGVVFVLVSGSTYC
jgi:hypothetical protein